jgi:hypothetical protein
MDRIDPVDKILASAGGNLPAIPLITPLENVFDSMGLMSGPLSPVWRASVGFGAVSAVMWAVRPGFAFDPSGAPRAWVHAQNSASSTAIPWWVLPAGAAILCGVFV